MLLAVSALVLLGGVIWWMFSRGDENPVDKLPGPSGKPLIGNILELMSIPADGFLNLIMDYEKRYGERFVFRVFQKKTLIITNPSDAEAILSHSKNITKNDGYQYFEPWLGSGLLLNTGKKWHSRRKVLAPAFHFNILKSYHVVMVEKIQNLISLLKETKGKEVNLMPVINDYTIMTIAETAMGTKLDTNQSTATLEYKNAITDIGPTVMKRFLHFWLQSDFIFNRSKLGKAFYKYVKIADDFGKNVIMEKKRQYVVKNESELLEEDGTKKSLALLDILLEAERKGDINFEGIRDEVNTFMFGGHDSTTMALTFGLMLLADHADVQEKIYEECKNLFEKCEGKPTMADFSEMKYLEAAIKEILRLYPSVPMLGRVVDEDFMMRELLVKKGTDIMVNVYSIHRREDLYPNAEAFRPERFLDSERRHAYAFLPFSAGPRNCIGQRFGMLQLKSVLYEVIRNFKLEPKVKGWRPAIIAVPTLKPTEPVHVKFIPRN